MENFAFTPQEIVSILKKRYEIAKNNGVEIKEEDISKKEIESFIVEYELKRFNSLFNNVFSDFEDIFEIDNGGDHLDSEDGVSEICLEIVNKIKENFQKVDKAKLLRFVFKLISKLVFKEEENAGGIPLL